MLYKIKFNLKNYINILIIIFKYKYNTNLSLKINYLFLILNICESFQKWNKLKKVLQKILKILPLNEKSLINKLQYKYKLYYGSFTDCYYTFLQNYKLENNFNFLKNKKNDNQNSNFDIFRSIISKKDILIVGPSHDKELKNYFTKDKIIVKFNYLNTNIDQHYQIKGCDISYLSGARVSRVSINDVNAHKDIFFVLKDKVYSKKFKNILPINNHRIISVNNLNFTIGSGMALINAIIDLKQFKPNKIIVCGINFYAEKANNYNKNYRITPEKISYTSLRLHNIVENYLFCKNMYENQYFEAIGITKNILNLENEYYFEKLDNNYGYLNLTDRNTIFK